MIRLLFILMMLPSLCAASGGMFPATGGWSYGGGSVPTWLDYWWTSNSASDTNDYGPSPTVGSSATYITGQVGNAVEFDTVGSSGTVILPSGTCDGSEGRVGFWFRAVGSVTGGVNVFKVVNGSDYVEVLTSSNGTAIATYYYVGGTIITAFGVNGAISADTWYYIEGAWKHDGADVTLTTYIDGVQTGTKTGTVDALDASSSSPIFGYTSGDAAKTLDFDNLVLSSDSTVTLYTNYRNQDGI